MTLNSTSHKWFDHFLVVAYIPAYFPLSPPPPIPSLPSSAHLLSSLERSGSVHLWLVISSFVDPSYFGPKIDTMDISLSMWAQLRFFLPFYGHVLFLLETTSAQNSVMYRYASQSSE